MDILAIVLGSKEVIEFGTILMGMSSTAIFGKAFEDVNELVSFIIKSIGISIGTIYASTKLIALVKYIILMFCLL